MTANSKKDVKQLQASKYQQADNENLGMNWFMFTINFRLFAGIVAYIVDFFRICYDTNCDFEITITASIVTLLCIYANLLVRYLLSHFRRNAIKWYFGLMYCTPVILYTFTALATEDLLSSIGNLSFLIYIIPELIYYHKRKHLFDVTKPKREPKVKCEHKSKKSQQLLLIITSAISVISLLCCACLFYECNDKENTISSLLDYEGVLYSQIRELKSTVAELKEENNSQAEQIEELKQQPIKIIVPERAVYSNNDSLCAIPSCNNTAANNSFYCSTHECSEVGCHEKTANDFCNYCILHKCAVPDCKWGKAYKSEYCYVHKN